MQKIIRDKQGIIRFKANKIVKFLAKGKLNELSTMEFSQADWEQLYQLIGYSISGYHELNQVSDVSALKASRKAEAK